LVEPFGGLLATGLAKIRFSGYNRWPWIFFVKGAITVLFGLLTVSFLPHTPRQAKCLTEEVKVAAVARMNLDAHAASQASIVEGAKFSWLLARMAVPDVNTILLPLNISATITPIYSIHCFCRLSFPN